MRRLLPLLLLAACSPPEGTATSPLLEAGATSLLGLSADALAWGDWNGDGRPDLFVATNSGTLPNPGSVALHLGTDGFVESSPAWTFGPTNTINDLAVGDLASDGDLDVAVAVDGALLVLRNEGTLAIGSTWIANNSDAGTDVDWVDVDGDGDLDLSMLRTAGGLAVHVQPDTGSLSVNPSLTTPAVGAVAVDWGRPRAGVPVAAIARTNGSIDLYQESLGSLVNLTTLSTGQAQALNTVVFGDLDDDGDDDLVAAVAAGTLRVLTTDGAGLWATATSMGASTDASSLAFADWDGDGDRDLAVGYFGGGNPEVFQNSGGSLDTSPVWTGNSSVLVTDLAWAELDGGGPELVYATISQGILVHPGQGWGLGSSAPSSSLVGAGGSLTSVEFGDLDGDGALDVLAGATGAGDRAFSLGGYPAVSNVWSEGVAWNTTGVALGDVDGDGRLDRVVTRASTSGIGNPNIVVE